MARTPAATTTEATTDTMENTTEAAAPKQPPIR